MPPLLATDPCPSAIVAVQLAVAPVRRPIERIVIEPGPFFCGVLWIGAQSMPPCYEPPVGPGQYMHAWVWFRASAEVAAVALGLDLEDDNAPTATGRPAWHTTVLAVEIPPTRWVMP